MMRASRKDPTATPPYLSHFGLHSAPFSATGTANLFYADPEREQTLNLLQHLTQYSEELLLVSGPQGVGKTCLLEQFAARADEHWKVCRVNARESADPGQLFLYAAECFGLDTGSVRPDGLIEALRNHLNAMQPEVTPVLVVDDAHALNDDALEIVVRLAELKGDHGRLVRTILFAEPSLDQRLAAPRFQSMPQPHRLELKPLDEGHTGDYIAHRLAGAGFSATSPFTPKVVRRIFKHARGYPAAINAQAHEVLMERYGAERRSALGPLGRIPARYLIGVLALAGIAAVAVTLRGPLLGLIHGHKGAPPPAASGGAPGPVAAPPPPPPHPVARDGNGKGATYSLTLQPGQSLQVSCAVPGGAQPQFSPLPPPRATEPLVQPLQGPAALPGPKPAAPPANGNASPPAVGKGSAKAEAGGPAKAAPAHKPTAQPLPAKGPAKVAATGPTTAKKGVAKTHAAGQSAAKAAKAPPHAEAKAHKAKARPEAPAPKLTAVIPDPVTGSLHRQALTVKGSGLKPKTRLTVSWPGHSKRLPRSRVDFVDAKRVRMRITTGFGPARWGVKATNPDGRSSAVLPFTVEPPPKPHQRKATPHKAKVTKPAAPSARGGLHGAAWAFAQPAGHYTLQLSADNSRAAAAAFVHHHPVPAPRAIAEERRGGRRLFIVLQGSYRSAAAAAAAGKRLRGVKGFWARRFADLHKTLVHPAPAKVHRSATRGRLTLRGPAWLRARDSRHYTLQLTAGRDRRAILTYLERRHPTGTVAVYRSERDGKPWYALTWGDFPTHGAAETAIRTLPAAIRRGKPWVRQFAAVQRELGPSAAGR